MEQNKHKFIKNQSILYGLTDEYNLSKREFFILYSFYVTYSMCGNQSLKKRTFGDYGWSCEKIEEAHERKKCLTQLGIALNSVTDLPKNQFGFLTDKKNLSQMYKEYDLGNGKLRDYNTERAVIGKTNENNKYLKLFYRIRDGLAHGKYILKLSSNGEKMVIVQDDDTKNVTGRIVIKLSTLMSFVRAIDLNGIVYFDVNNTEEGTYNGNIQM